MPAIAIVAAAGQGTRFGHETPKQFLLLDNRPVLAHTLERFETSNLIEETVLVAAQEWIPYIGREIIGRFRFKKCRQVVPGGKQRQDSVWAGLQAIKERSDCIVLIHDAVRPLFSQALVKRVIEACENYVGGIPALMPKDTVKKIEGRNVVETIPRVSLRLAQTPQAFRKETLERAYSEAMKNNFYGTDEAALVEKIGATVGWIEGEETNLKITTPHDLKIAERILKERI